VIEQAIYGCQDAGGYRFLGRSAGFRDEWLAEAERLCTGFGERPAGVSCPSCVFAQPLGRRHVAVVQVADQGTDDTGRPGALGFRLLAVPRPLYADLGGDPFLLAEQFPPPWEARGDLPALEWQAGAPPPRTVAELRRVLDVPNGPTLLGGVQALLDGGRLVFERTWPDTPLVRSLWALLPTQSRSEMWPASFSFRNARRFHVVVVPRAAGPDLEHYIPEEQAGDYPEGRYELALQTAVESGNQEDLDVLLARRSRSQTVRLALAILAASVAVALGTALLSPNLPPPPPTTAKTSPAAVARPDLPPPDECPQLSAREREDLADRLKDLGRRLKIDVPAGATDADLTQALAAIDEHLPAPQGQSAPLRDLGPIQRQVRALLWKHEVPEYNQRGLNTMELIDRLRKHLVQKGIIREESGG
jgi:hypothetical protein